MKVDKKKVGKKADEKPEMITIEIPKYIKRALRATCSRCQKGSKTRYRCGICQEPLHNHCVDAHYAVWQSAPQTHSWQEVAARRKGLDPPFCQFARVDEEDFLYYDDAEDEGDEYAVLRCRV